MSQTCATSKCERKPRALCDCCKKNLCLQHLNEHNTVILSQLNPLTDEINTLGDRFKSVKFDAIVSDGRRKLKQWQTDCHEKIDSLFEKKCQEFDRLVTEKLNQQQEKILDVQSKISKLIHDQEATRQDISALTSTIRDLEIEMKKVERADFQINTRSLLIDDNFIEITKKYEHEFDLANLEPAYKTLDSPNGGYIALTSNDRFLLIHQAPNLCLVDREMNVKKQVLWEYKDIWDMCWSLALNRFIVIEDTNVFLVDERTMSMEKIEILSHQNWLSCVCSNAFLYLSTNTWGSSVVELRLLPSIVTIREWKSPVTCTAKEIIDGIAYSSDRCAIVIKNKVEKSLRMELRSCATFDRIWSYRLNCIFNGNLVFRCCSLAYEEWLVIDHETNHLLHITKDGKLKGTMQYKEKPYRAIWLDSGTLVVFTQKGINFHKI